MIFPEQIEKAVRHFDKLRNQPETRVFLHAAHAMNGAELAAKSAAKTDAIALLTILEETTQSRSIAERCAKARAVLS